jgi:hypothetical protein
MFSLHAIAPRLLRRYALLAVLTLAFNAVAPSLAQAFGTPAQGRLVEMCTGLGMQQVFIPAADDTSDPAKGLAFKHCPFCLGGEPLPPLPVVRPAPPGNLPATVAASIGERPPAAPSYRFCSPTPPRGPPLPA